MNDYEQAQARVTAAADYLETLDGHLARYAGRPIRLASHLGETHRHDPPAHLDVTAQEELHAYLHSADLHLARQELARAEDALARLQREQVPA